MNKTEAAIMDPVQKIVDAKVILAPMAGITDVPFRIMTSKFGCAFAFTEMIDVNAIIYGNRKTLTMMEKVSDDEPLAVQLVGQDKEKMMKAVGYCIERDFNLIDINVGCPARKVVKLGKGSALLQEVDKLADILSTLVREFDVPFTVKIRSGWDEENKNYLEVVKAVEEAGASAVCIHPRTREQFYKGTADHNVTREIKEAVDIPVFASGNIFSAKDAVDVFEHTKCDAVFVARGSLGSPWIFREIKQAMRGEAIQEKPFFDEIKDIMLEHYVLNCKHYGEKWAGSRMYKHIAWYLKKHKNINDIMIEYRKCGTLSSFEEFLARLGLEEGKYLCIK